MTHVYVSKLCHLWWIWWHVSASAPRQYLNHCCLFLLISALKMNFSDTRIWVQSCLCKKRNFKMSCKMTYISLIGLNRLNLLWLKVYPYRKAISRYRACTSKLPNTKATITSTLNFERKVYTDCSANVSPLFYVHRQPIVTDEYHCLHCEFQKISFQLSFGRDCAMYV